MKQFNSWCGTHKINGEVAYYADVAWFTQDTLFNYEQINYQLRMYWRAND